MRCGIVETAHHGIAETVHCGIAETSLTGTSSADNDIEPIGHCLCTYKGIRFSRDSSKARHFGLSNAVNESSHSPLRLISSRLDGGLLRQRILRV